MGQYPLSQKYLLCEEISKFTGEMRKGSDLSLGAITKGKKLPNKQHEGRTVKVTQSKQLVNVNRAVFWVTMYVRRT